MLAQVNLKVVPEKHFMHRVWLVTWVGETIAGETIVGELVLLCPLASGRRGRGHVSQQPQPPHPQALRGGYKVFWEKRGHRFPQTQTRTHTEHACAQP